MMSLELCTIMWSRQWLLSANGHTIAMSDLRVLVKEEGTTGLGVCCVTMRMHQDSKEADCIAEGTGSNIEWINSFNG